MQDAIEHVHKYKLNRGHGQEIQSPTTGKWQRQRPDQVVNVLSGAGAQRAGKC